MKGSSDSRMQRSILLTGGTGFFGRALLRSLLATEETTTTVHVLTRRPEEFLSRYPEFAGLEWLILHRGDIMAPESLPRSKRFTHILHAATDSTFGPLLSPLQRFEQIVDGTRNILDLAVTAGAQRFLLTSSGAVYGAQPQDLPALPEDWPGSPTLENPANAYGLGKRAAEHLCALYREAHGLETVVARCFAFVGPDLPLDVHFAIGNFIHNALHTEGITVAGDGTPLRSYLDQSDLALWLLTLMEAGRPGQAYNVGSDESISIADLANLVREILAPEKPVRILGQATSGAARNRYLPDIHKAQRELGLRVTIPLAEAIRRTGETLRSNLPQKA